MSGFLQKSRNNVKRALLGALGTQLEQQAASELAEGKLVSPTSLDEVCNRIIPALRDNPVTGGTLKALGVKDSELRSLLEAAFIKVGVELK